MSNGLVMKNSTTIKILLLFVCAPSFLDLSAQDKSEKQAQLLKEDAFKTFDSNEVIGNGQITALRDKGYTLIGTTYFLEELLPGKVRMVKNDEFLEGVELRYNIFFDRLEVSAHNVLFAAINEQIGEFVINDDGSEHHFINSTSIANPDSELGYVRYIQKGDRFSLFAKDLKVKQVKESRGAYASTGGTNVLQFVTQINYYIYDQEGKELVMVKSKKKLLERFPALSDFGSISKSDLKSEKFIASINTFLNSQTQ